MGVQGAGGRENRVRHVLLRVIIRVKALAPVTEALNAFSGWLRFVKVGRAEGKTDMLASSVLEITDFSIPKGMSSEIRPIMIG